MVNTEILAFGRQREVKKNLLVEPVSQIVLKALHHHKGFGCPCGGFHMGWPIKSLPTYDTMLVWLGASWISAPSAPTPCTTPKETMQCVSTGLEERRWPLTSQFTVHYRGLWKGGAPWESARSQHYRKSHPEAEREAFEAELTWTQATTQLWGKFLFLIREDSESVKSNH